MRERESATCWCKWLSKFPSCIWLHTAGNVSYEQFRKINNNIFWLYDSFLSLTRRAPRISISIQFQFLTAHRTHTNTRTHTHTHMQTDSQRTHFPRLQAKFCNLQMQLRHSLLGLASFAFGQSDSCLKCVGNSNSSNYNSNSNNIDSSNSNFGSSSYNSPGHINKCQREKVTKPTDCCCSIWILQALLRPKKQL